MHQKLEVSHGKEICQPRHVLHHADDGPSKCNMGSGDDRTRACIDKTAHQGKDAWCGSSNIEEAAANMRKLEDLEPPVHENEEEVTEATKDKS